MIIERDCTILLDMIYEQEVEIVVHEGVRVTVIDIKKGLTERHKKITLIAERNSTILYEALLTNASHTKKIIAIARGEYADIQMHIGSIGTKDEQYHIETEQIHEGAYSISACTVKALGYDQSLSSYEGIISITKNGVHTQAHQQHKALLLDENARAYARPSIEVQIDEVQCGHGSAIGQLDEEQLLYMQTRGIDMQRAIKLLTYAFIHDLFTVALLKQQVKDRLID